ncbi:LysR family transcriptional regulator [Collinsella vaginalis]|uniref:LysR family transcriptional regulator n=1 Tax=Collinsella vaginalis TaxID=1870987 RepID=UPI0015C4F747|nr:LysR family transcriptional regulator [Collinsella vaginalis]
MELRVLEYFLAVARAGSISAAAEELHVSQPTLSRQLIDLERGLGTTLFERSRAGVTLTADGMLLRRRAAEIVDLARTTESEIMMSRGAVAGEVRIGCAETRAMELLAQVMGDLKADHPQVTYRIISADADDVAERIERGLLDFGLVLRLGACHRLDSLELPSQEQAVVVLPSDDPLAKQERFTPADLEGLPLIAPWSSAESGILGGMRSRAEGGSLNVVATYNLSYNATRLVKMGLGYAVSLAGLGDVSAEDGLTARPLDVPLDMPAYLVWKPFQLRTRACEALLERAREAFGGAGDQH